jgi:excisionase family DNA binding protein
LTFVVRFLPNPEAEVKTMDKIILTTHEELKQLIADSLQAVLKGHDASLHADAVGQSGAKYLTVSEAARYLNLAKQTVYGFTSRRTIPFIKRAKRLLFTKSDLDAWLAHWASLGSAMGFDELLFREYTHIFRCTTSFKGVGLAVR